MRSSFENALILSVDDNEASRYSPADWLTIKSRVVYTVMNREAAAQVIKE